MTDCAKLKTCPFFNDSLQKMPNVAEMLKRQYCRDNFQACARYQVSEQLGPQAVPENLFPHQLERLPDLMAR